MQDSRIYARMVDISNMVLLYFGMVTHAKQRCSVFHIDINNIEF
jgi:hypothetical protein